MTAKDELLRLLNDATAFVADYDTMNLFCGFETGAEFAAELHALRDRLVREDWSALGPLVAIFAPTSAWDDGVGVSGIKLAERVMELLDVLTEASQSHPHP